MAVRPVFVTNDVCPYFKKVNTEFTFCSGFSLQQKQRCVVNLHTAYETRNKEKKILEISRASDSPLGTALSAFNLMIVQKNGVSYSVESAFQSSKCFEKGGPYKDILYKNSFEAKKDLRLKESGKLTGFRISGMDFPLNPPTYFYDWLYVNALYGHPEYHEELLQYDAFTDIMFNPERQINCQAQSVAIFCSLYKAGKLEEALEDRQGFLEVVYGEKTN